MLDLITLEKRNIYLYKDIKNIMQHYPGYIENVRYNINTNGVELTFLFNRIDVEELFRMVDRYLRRWSIDITSQTEKLILILEEKIPF